jgi:hypothetical protein
MTQKAEFIKIPTAPGGLPQTLPTEPERRLPSSDISISEAVVEDLPQIVCRRHCPCFPISSLTLTR